MSLIKVSISSYPESCLEQMIVSALLITLLKHPWEAPSTWKVDNIDKSIIFYLF